MFLQQLQFNFNKENDTSWVWEVLEKHEKRVANREKLKKFLKPLTKTQKNVMTK
jgi:hypothetical protein